ATDATTNAAVRLIGGIRWNSISTPGTWVTPSNVFTTYLENGFLTPSRTTGTSVGIGGVAISESSGLYIKETSDFETVTNLSVTLETTGRPVFVGLIGDPDNVSWFYLISLQTFRSAEFRARFRR